jgi:hypothetical protein
LNAVDRAQQLSEIKALVVQGPDPARDGIVRWRCVDVREQIIRRYSVELHERTVGKLLRRFGLTRLQPRPYHPKKDVAAQEAFKTYGPPRPQAVSAYDPCQSASTYPACGHSPGQDGDPRVPVLIKLTASERHF